MTPEHATDGTPPPIDIPCEGSGQPPCQLFRGLGRCAMCGQFFYFDKTGNVRAHQRRDILAMLARGDFNQ